MWPVGLGGFSSQTLSEGARVGGEVGDLEGLDL